MIATNTNTSNAGSSNVGVAPRLEDLMNNIMNEFRVGDKKSNIMQLNMTDYFPNDPVVKVASLLEQSSNLSNKMYRMNFDPVQEIVLKKMVGEKTFDKRLIIEQNDFFKGIFFLDYYCGVIAKSYDVIDSLYDYAKQLERVDRSKDPVMKDVVEHVLADSFSKGLFMNNNYVERNTQTAYNSLKQNIDLSGSRYIRVGQLYQGAAKIIIDTVDSLGLNLNSIGSRADLNALIFTDALYPYISSDPDVKQVDTMLGRKDFMNASITALEIASKKYYAEHMEKRIRRNYND